MTGIGSTAARAQVRVAVAYAGSMAAVMTRGLGPGAERAVGVQVEGRPQGAYALAHLIAAGAIQADVFISMTAGPMAVLERAHRVGPVTALASTEMVIAYSPAGPRAAEFAALARLSPAAALPGLLRVLSQPGIRFGRTNPETDPQGRNIIFALRRATAAGGLPASVDRILGPVINPKQIFPESGMMARLQSGQLDAASAYAYQPPALGLPYLRLPAGVNLGDLTAHPAGTGEELRLGEESYGPMPLVIYAAVVRGAVHADAASVLVDWLGSPAARKIWRQFGFAPPPTGGRG